MGFKVTHYSVNPHRELITLSTFIFKIFKKLTSRTSSLEELAVMNEHPNRLVYIYRLNFSKQH